MFKIDKDLLNGDLSIGRIKAVDKILFAKHLSIMLKSGLAISEALDILYKQTKGRMKNVVAGIKNSVESGNSFSSSLADTKNVFSQMFISSVYIGESSGMLSENLENIADRLSREQELKNKVKGAMFYPSIVMILAFGLGLVMSFVVLPKILPLFNGLDIDLPMSTRFLIWFSAFIQNNSGKIIFILFVSVVAFIWFIRQEFSRPITSFIILKIPIVNKINCNNNLAIFCGTLGNLLKSGLNIDEALDITRGAVGNYYFKKSLEQVALKTRQGNKLTDSLEEYGELYPDLAVSMLKVGEKSGRLEETFFYLSEYYEAEVDNSTKKLSVAIEPILLIFIGLVVGGLAISIITPIYQLTGGVHR